MAITAALRSTEPLKDLNTTPLIDVMLVLLVMFIMTIPIATNSLDVDLPGTTTSLPIKTDRNVLSVTRGGAYTWNGETVSDVDLSVLLAQVRHALPEPQVEYRPDPEASYARAAEALLIVEQAGISNFGFSGNEVHRSFGK